MCKNDVLLSLCLSHSTTFSGKNTTTITAILCPSWSPLASSITATTTIHHICQEMKVYDTAKITGKSISCSSCQEASLTSEITIDVCQFAAGKAHFTEPDAVTTSALPPQRGPARRLRAGLPYYHLATLLLSKDSVLVFLLGCLFLRACPYDMRFSPLNFPTFRIIFWDMLIYFLHLPIQFFFCLGCFGPSFSRQDLMSLGGATFNS